MDKKTILIVEDEAITAMDTQNFLKKMGYNVPFIVDSGEEALARAEESKPDLVLMDIVLKGKLSGTDTAQQLYNHYQIPIIFITAYNDKETFNRAKLSAPYAYLTKPYDTKDLRIVVELALHKHQMELELLAETHRIKSEFLANMSHELRTPLNGIIGFTELMYRGKIGTVSEDAREYLNDILNSSKHLLSLINDILDISKTESGKMDFILENTNIENLFSEVTNSIRTISNAKNLEIQLHIDPQIKSLVCDRMKLKQILYNFISNAIKFSHNDNKIEVNVSVEGKDYYRIAVKDFGIGIAAEDLQKLFTPFKQLDISFAKNYQGTGLGLALTKRIVEAQGGQVGVNSEVGKGSTFFVLLPIVAAKALEKVQEQEIHV